MPHEMLNSMRSLREDMRQRLMQVPEYRALMALDRSIEEICDILRDTLSLGGPQGAIAPVADGEPMVAQTRSSAAMPAHAPQRQGAIATAFAESLAARLDQRGGLRGGGPYQTPPGHRGG
jgi:hypothetical protein